MPRGRSLLAFVLLPVMSGVASLAAAQAPSRDEAWRQCSADDPATSLKGCGAVLALAGESGAHRARAFVNRGITYRDLGLPAEAIQDFTAAIALDARYARAFVERGATYQQQKQVTAAVADYERAITIDPSLTARLRAAEAQMGAAPSAPTASSADWDRCQENADIDARLAACTAVIQSGAADTRARALYLRAWAYNEKGSYESALADVDRAITSSGGSAEAFAERGYAAWRLKRYPAAIDAYNQSLLLRPNHANTLLERGLLHFVTNQYAAARIDAEAVLRVEATNAKALYLKGVLKRLGGDRSGDADMAAAKQQRADIEQVMAADGVQP